MSYRFIEDSDQEYSPHFNSYNDDSNFINNRKSRRRQKRMVDEDERACIYYYCDDNSRTYQNWHSQNSHENEEQKQNQHENNGMYNVNEQQNQQNQIGQQNNSQSQNSYESYQRSQDFSSSYPIQEGSFDQMVQLENGRLFNISGHFVTSVNFGGQHGHLHMDQHHEEARNPNIKNYLTKQQLTNLPVLIWSQQNKKRNSVEICNICMGSPYEIGEQLRVLKCLHRFHLQCVDEWLMKKNNCPTCRQEIVIQDYFQHGTQNE